MNSIQLSFRNILRHRNRSVVTIMTVCLGFTALGVIGGILGNIFSRLKGQAIVAEKMGHITFAKQGFFDNGKLEPEKYLWSKQELAGIMQILKADPEVALATPRLRMFGIASNSKSSTIFITEAIVPEDDQQLLKTPIDGRTEKGMMSLAPQKGTHPKVAISEELSHMLGIKKGQNITMLTTTKDGMANAVDADVENVYNTGNPATNDKFILSDYTLAQNLYDTDGAERVVATLKHPEKLAGVKAALTSKLNQAGYKIEARGWDEQSPSYKKVTTMFGVIFRVLTIIITVIVLLTLLNTMQVTVNERTKEIGTMRAIGMLKRGVIKIFCIEGLMMGIFGCIIALPILFLVSGILQASHASFVPPVASTSIPLVLKLEPQKIIPVFVLFCVASLLSSFIVSRRISNQKVVNSLMQFN
ncbi:MAG: ABC transporter permease [Williamsia sp.]|nr:ABC transporter permease [Williamsia sp.]